LLKLSRYIFIILRIPIAVLRSKEFLRQNSRSAEVTTHGNGDAHHSAMSYPSCALVTDADTRAL
jgi:hypothetical protein